MSSFLKNGAAWLASQRKQHLSELVEYERIGVGSTEVWVMPGHTEAEVDREDGYRESIRPADFKLTPSDLVIENEPTMPADGDLIRRRVAGGIATYQVVPLGSEPWRYADNHEETIRIHTKRIKFEPC